MIMRYINSHLHLNNIYIYVVERLSMTIYGYAQSVFILVYFISSISDKNVGVFLIKMFDQQYIQCSFFWSKQFYILDL